MSRFKTYIARILTAAVAICCLESCILSKEDYTGGKKRVFIIYSIGYNNLSGYLKEDLKEVEENFRPRSPMDIIVMLSHSTIKSGDYKTPNPPVLTQLRLGPHLNLVRDTLKVYPANSVSASTSTLQDVLEHVKAIHPNADYGLLFSSHSTGWAPADYCNDPDGYESAAGSGTLEAMRARTGTDRARKEATWGIQQPDGSPVVKSFGAQFEGSSRRMSEMDITDMAKAIPMKMDYIIFDSCLMGGVEVAYEFKDVCKHMIFSQTEILADGMDYKKLPSRIFSHGEPEVQLICEDYYNQYIEESGQYRSATISLIDCSRLDELAAVCRKIFESHREEIAESEGSSLIQAYFRADEHRWFYDLESIVRKCAPEMVQELHDAMDKCVVYKAATERFITIRIREHCGLSMYLPYAGRTYLNNFYRTLAWNKATELVK